jgi:hypothetical protein
VSTQVSREQVVRCLRDAGWTFKRQAPKVDIWKKRGAVSRISIPRRDLLPMTAVLTILKSAGLTPQQIEDFLRSCVKS